MDAAQRVFNIIEAARYLRVSKAYVWKLIARGKLRATRIGRRTVVRETAIRAMLDNADAESPLMERAR
jgi:excisionase family DNA binding protein